MSCFSSIYNNVFDINLNIFHAGCAFIRLWLHFNEVFSLVYSSYKGLSLQACVLQYVQIYSFTSRRCLTRDLRAQRLLVKEKREWLPQWVERNLTCTTAPHLYSCSSSASASASTPSSSSCLTSCLSCCPTLTALCLLKRRCEILGVFVSGLNIQGRS